MTGIVAENQFKNKAIEIAKRLGISVESIEEFYSHKLNNHVMEKRYKVNQEINIIVNLNDVFGGRKNE
jgi:hypothetical protein